MPSRFVKSMLMGVFGGGVPVVPVTYLLDDEFTTSDGTGSRTRTCVPGPDSLVITDASSAFAISGALTWTAVGSANPFLRSNTQFARTVGRALFGSYINAGARTMYGFSNVTAAGNSSHGLQFNNTTLTLTDAITSGVNLTIGTITATPTTYQFAIVQRSSGIFVFIKGGVFSNWTLVWVDALGSFNTYCTTYALSSAAGANSLDFFRLIDLAAPFTTDEGIASVNVSTPVSGASQTATANGIHDFAFTVSGTPAAGDRYELRYNVLDASNYNVAYIVRNASNTAYDFECDKVVAGTPTALISLITGVGNVDTIRVVHDTNNHDCFTKVTTTWTKRGATVSDANQSTQAAIQVGFIVGTSVSLKSYPRTSATYTNGLTAGNP